MAVQSVHTINRALANTKQVCYWRSTAAWRNFWVNFDATKVAADLAKFASIGATSVRAILTWADPNTYPGCFGYISGSGPWTYTGPNALALANLKAFITMADSLGMTVKLDLYDYAPIALHNETNQVSSKAWIDTVIAPYASDARICMIDLKNEIDLIAVNYAEYGSGATSQANIDAWQAAMLPYLRAAAGTIPVTICCSDNQTAGYLTQAGAPSGALYNCQVLWNKLKGTAAEPDLWEIHLYTNGYNAPGRMNLFLGYAKGKPIFMGEFGFSTNPNNSVSNLNYYGGSPGATSPLGAVPNYSQVIIESYQDYVLRRYAAGAQALGMLHVCPWHINDLYGSGRLDVANQTPEAVDAADGNLGSVLQYYRGMFRPDGSSKPSAVSLQAHFTGATIDASFNAGFDTVDTDGFPLQWKVDYSGVSNSPIPFLTDAVTTHPGSGYSASIKASPSSGRTTALVAWRICPIKVTLPNKSYTLTGWMKTSAATGKNSIAILWYDANLATISVTRSTNITGTVDWTQYTVTSTMPATAAYCEIRCESDGNSGQTWFDDMAFA